MLKRWGIAFVLVATILPVVPACKPHATDDTSVIVKADSQGLLLTWFDDFGDFHVAQSVADVPTNRREHVRVIDPSKADGTKDDRIFVADLRQAQPDGRFPIRITTRAEFEKLARANSQSTGPIASAAHSTAPNPEMPTQQAPDVPANPQSPVIIYGAEWCQPCHQAAAYLKRKGVKVVEKDIEADPAAGREMRAKLARAGLHGGSIPVIDVHGRMLIGFSQSAMDQALGQTL